MLVLTRKVAEKLYIGSDICVTVVRLKGGEVRLGIEAPREVTVLRAELMPVTVRADEPAGRRLAPRERGRQYRFDVDSRYRHLTLRR
jgi:carbon storage regulator